MKDKVLAEFVLDLAKQSKTADAFNMQLEENGADFSVDLVNTLFALITRQLSTHNHLSGKVDSNIPRLAPGNTVKSGVYVHSEVAPEKEPEEERKAE
jgi:hypothetical protein